MTLSCYDDLIPLVQGRPQKTVALAAAQNLHALQAVVNAARQGFATYRLVGDKDAILRMAEENEIELDEDTIFPASTDADAAHLAVQLVRSGEAHFLMKGALGTATLLKAVLSKEEGLRGQGLMSHVGLLEVPGYHKLLAVSDGAMVPYPSFDQKKDILRNALGLLRSLGNTRPVVSALAAVETVSDKMPETAEAAQLKQLADMGEFGPCLLDGPLSYDLTMSADIARVKGFSSPVTGQVDLLLVPNIACGNVLVKCIVCTAGGMMAGCILGAKAPIVLASRGGSAREKEVSILLAAAGAGG